MAYLSAPWFLNYNMKRLDTSLFWGYLLYGEIITETTEMKDQSAHKGTHELGENKESKMIININNKN